ncbi:MAG: hypothetical protein EBR88_04260, partial [Betaproteobacteria bacterium]|nr:hypothetical protein [Betaproteobacteria bacterium]
SDASKPMVDSALLKAASARIDLLISLVQRHPDASDEISAWIGGTTKLALTHAGVYNLFTLVDLIKRHGASWWKHVPKLGPVRALRLQEWLLEINVRNAALSAQDVESVQLRRLLQIAASSPAATPPALVRLRLEPLAPYIENTHLNGSTGLFRGTGPNMLKADHDIDALVTALSKYQDRPQTLTVYARELLRFYLWAYLERHLPVSSLGVEDARLYREFLQEVPRTWITDARSGVVRGSSDWRPFRGQLDESSQRKALTCVNVILAQLMNSGYLTGNPMAGVLKHSGLAKPAMNVMRSFTPEQWALIEEVMASQPPSPSQRRTTALMYLLHATGMRRQELFGARLSHIQRLRVDGENALLLTVIGKGNKERQVLIPSDVMSMVEAHLQDRPARFMDDPHSTEGRSKIPLISTLYATISHYRVTPATPTQAGDVVLERRALASPDGALSPDGMGGVLSRLLRKAYDVAAQRGMDTAAFQSATLHWLRHTFGHTMADSDVDLRIIQKAMGHVNINTTGHYSKAEVQQMVRGIRKGRAIAAQAVPELLSSETMEPVVQLPPT